MTETDWATIATFATALGTLVLAVATFSSVRSGNRAARTAERALQAQLRPLLVPSRLEDPMEKILWGDGHWSRVSGGRASVELVDGIIYLAMSVRNVGSGIAVLHGWNPSPIRRNAAQPHDELSAFRLQTRDLYVPPGDSSFWQGAVREPDDAIHEPLTTTIQSRQMFSIDLLYGDNEGGQRTITRFAVVPRDNDTDWMCSVARHWNLDRPDPR